MEKHLNVTEELTPDGIKFTIKGRVNSECVEEFQGILQSALDREYKNVILNMLWVEFLSSAGIRVILKAYKDMIHAGGKLGIEMPSKNVRNVLGMTALDDMLIK